MVAELPTSAQEILVVANQTLGDERLMELVGERIAREGTNSGVRPVRW